jgi:conjugative relaxase-like TrwC/TraI family protein
VLRVTTIHANTAGASARYYTRYLAEEGPDGEGYWLGRQAEGLGLSGRVSTDDLEALLSGHDPATGTGLGRAFVDRYDTEGRLMPAVAGFDGTFSAPKALSVWWGLSGDPGLPEAHDVAVRAVLEHVERYGATTRVRVNGARQHPDTQGLTMAVFRQATSREDDPQIHSHVVFSAKVRTPDGRWMALDARYLKRHQRALGGLYQSVLRAELSHRYGVAWGPVDNGQAEIAGTPAELLAAFSKRTAQVDTALADKITDFRGRQGRDPSRWERAALTREAASDTRDAKTGRSASDLAGAWCEEAAALGWTADRVATSMRVAARATPAREPVTLAGVIELLSARGSTWTRPDVLRAVCDLAPPVSQMPGRDWAHAVEDACDRVVERCVTLDPPGTGTVRESDGRSIWLAPPSRTSPTSTSSPKRSASSCSPWRRTRRRPGRRPRSTGAASTSSKPTQPPPWPARVGSSSSSGRPARARPRCSATPPTTSATTVGRCSRWRRQPRPPRSCAPRPASPPTPWPSCSTNGATDSPPTRTDGHQAPRSSWTKQA